MACTLVDHRPRTWSKAKGPCQTAFSFPQLYPFVGATSSASSSLRFRHSVLLFLPSCGHILYVLGPNIFLAKLMKLLQSCSRFFPFVSLCLDFLVEAVQLQLRFSSSGLPGFHVLSESLPDFFLLEPFSVPTRSLLPRSPSSTLGGCRPSQSWLVTLSIFLTHLFFRQCQQMLTSVWAFFPVFDV